MVFAKKYLKSMRLVIRHVANISQAMPVQIVANIAANLSKKSNYSKIML